MSKMQNARCSKNVDYYCYCNEKKKFIVLLRDPTPPPRISQFQEEHYAGMEEWR